VIWRTCLPVGSAGTRREIRLISGLIPRFDFADEHGGKLGLVAGVVNGSLKISRHYNVFQEFICGFPGGFCDFRYKF
jgi:hypothetical protein